VDRLQNIEEEAEQRGKSEGVDNLGKRPDTKQMKIFPKKKIEEDAKNRKKVTVGFEKGVKLETRSAPGPGST